LAAMRRMLWQQSSPAGAARNSQSKLAMRNSKSSARAVAWGSSWVDGDLVGEGLQPGGIVAGGQIVGILDQEAEAGDARIAVAASVGDLGGADAKAHRRDQVVDLVGEVLEDNALLVVRRRLAIGGELELVLAVEKRVVGAGLGKAQQDGGKAAVYLAAAVARGRLSGSAGSAAGRRRRSR